MNAKSTDGGRVRLNNNIADTYVLMRALKKIDVAKIQWGGRPW